MEVRGDDGWPLVPNRRKQRVLLALLLSRANTVVPNEAITEALWDGRPPPSAAANLTSYVADLRALLRRGEASGTGRIRSQRGGYLLLVAADELDVAAFQRLTDEGRAALSDGDPAAAAECLARALGQWRGSVLEGIGALPEALEAERVRLEELRVAALEDSIEARLALAVTQDLPAELEMLVREHPLRERLWGQLMLALYRQDRRGEALAAYQRLSALLDTELGVLPGAPLQRLYQMILVADPVLNAPARPGPATTRMPIPHQLPADVAAFTGHADELAALDRLLAGTGPPDPVTAEPASTAVVISVVSGTAGVGKTALAVHWAHRVADRFPDGQLYVNLRGFHPGGSVLPAAEAVRGFLDALGVPSERMPPQLDAQVALYRSLLAGKRILLVLDNASDAEQVRPLLPGTPGALAMVTSRHQLTPLVATDGAFPLTLPMLSTVEARELVARRLGTARVAAEPAAVEQIITACARLPLALSIAIARLQQTGFPLAALADELGRAGQRLGALDAGDPASEVSAVFSWSYTTLTAPAARLFRLLGLHPGPDISVPAAASLAGQPVGRTGPMLTELARASLITEHLPGRYTFHDLLRAYATDLAHTHDPHRTRHAATTRLIEHYVHTAHTADRHLGAHRDPIPLRLTPHKPGVHPEPLANRRESMTWLTVEHPVLLAMLRQAADGRLDTHTWQLAWALDTFLHWQGHWHDLADAWQIASHLASRLDDPAAAAYARRLLARANIRLGRYPDAEDDLRQALDIYTRTGDQVGQAHTHQQLSILWEHRSRIRKALRHAEQALTLYESTGHARGYTNALNIVGWYHALLGHHTDALTYCQHALTLHQRVDNRHGQAASWDSLGYAHYHLGHHTQAANCYQHALTLLRELGDRHEEADTLTRLGHNHHAAGNSAAARTAWQRALDILTDLGHPDADAIRATLCAPDQHTRDYRPNGVSLLR